MIERPWALGAADVLDMEKDGRILPGQLALRYHVD